MKSLILADDPLISNQLDCFLDRTALFEKPFFSKTIAQALINLRDQPIDLLLLDLELTDMPGLDLVKILPINCPVIVTSANANYAVDSYDYDITDFLLKPLSYSRFLQALRRTLMPANTPGVVDYQAILPVANRKKQLINQPSNSPLPPNFIYLKTGRKTERFVFNDILYLESYTIYSKLITSQGTFVVNDRLSNLSKQLNPKHFIRIHKSYVINLEQVTQFSTNMIWLNTHKIPIGVTFKREVQEYLIKLGIHHSVTM